MLEGALVTAVLFGAFGLSMYFLITRSERDRISGIERAHCPHHAHGRLRIYTRPVRRMGRKDIHWICAGCGERMNGNERSGIAGGPFRHDSG